MSTSLLSVGTRSTLGRWFAVLVVGLLAVAAVTGFFAHGAHTDDHTTTETAPAGSWEVDASFDHGAAIQTESTVFGREGRLTNRPLYFTAVAPTLDATYTVGQDNTDGGSATASVTLTLVLRSVEETNGETVHWENVTVLDRAQDVTVPDGGEQTVDATVDIEAVTERVDDIESQLGAAPGTPEVLVRAEASVESSVEGETVSDRRSDRLVVSPGDGVYRVGTDVGPASSTTVTGERTVTDEPSALWLYGVPTVGGGALLGVLVLVTLRLRGHLAVSATERTRHEFETARADSDRWISRGRVPDLGDRTTVSLDSLDGLVDVAIDSDRRVIEDTDEDRLVVLADDIAYCFRPPDSGGESDEGGHEDSDSNAAAGDAEERDGDDSSETDGQE